MICRPRFALLALASLGLATAACQPPVFFPEFVMSTSEPGYNVPGGVAMGEGGDFIVTWTEGDASDPEVLGRRFDAETAPLGASFPVNADTTPQRRDSSVARDASGRFVVVWSQDITQIRGRRFASDGTPLGDDFPINTTTSLETGFPFIASDPSGNFVVTWTSGPLVDGDGVARRFDSHGAPLGGEFPVSAFTTGPQRPTGIAMSTTGFVVTWIGEGAGGDTGLFGRRFDATGAPTAGFQVNTEPVFDDYANRADVAMNAGGDFVVVWSDGVPYYVFGRRFDSAGAPLGNVFPVSQSTRFASRPRVASDSAGNFLVVWNSFPVPTDERQIHARLFDIAASPVSDEFQVNEITTALKFYARPSLADDGSFVVAFQSGDDDAYQVKGRKTAVRAAPEIVMDADPGLASSPGAAPGNGVFEPGETQVVKTAWVNDSPSLIDEVLGVSEIFTGPPGADYTLNTDQAVYDTLPAEQTTGCAEPDCFSVTVSNPAVRPVQHWDALLQEALSLSIPHTWVLHIGESFPDVPTGNLFYRFIETIFHNGVTGGCAGGGYCPTNPVTRAQMAVFLLKSKLGEAHIPPPCTGTVFTDVPCTGGAFDPWIEELADLGITGGCGGGNYCPVNTVTRQQMAVFLLKAFEGSAYLPPACTGIFDDVPCTPGTGFSDWIEELYARQITGGCSVTPLNYCPTNPNNRGQMAVFLTKTFGLVLYGG